MAVTKTYNLISIKPMDLIGSTSQSDAVGYANGNFAGIAFDGSDIDASYFNNAGTQFGGAGALFGTDGAVSRLASGDLVVASHDINIVVFQTIDSVSGAPVLPVTVIADDDNYNPDVAGLLGGSFVIVAEDEYAAIGGDADIKVHIRGAAGAVIADFAVDASLNRDTNASVAALDNGDFAVAWQRDTGGETEVWYAVYNSGGGTVKAPALADTAGTINRKPSVTAASSGFAIAYEDNAWSGDVDVTLARYNFAGALLGLADVSMNGVADSNPYVIRLGNGLLAVAYGAQNGDDDVQLKLVDHASGGVLAGATLTGGESIFDEQNFASLAGAGLGRIAAFWTNSTDAGIDGELVQGYRTSTGGAAGDTAIGDGFVDIMNGNGGDDHLYGGDNGDTLDGGAGNDAWLGGDAGSDRIYGGTGNDRIDGGADGDTWLGGDAGLDFITGGAGNDRIDGGADNDTWLGGDAGADTITGGLGNDRIDGGADSDTWLGGDAGADYITGGGGGDRADGGADSDTINGGAGRDFLTGGTGNDSITGGDEAGAGDIWLGGDAGIDYIYGNLGDDRIDGGADGDSLFGEGGADTITGGLGTDYIYGGAGADFLEGGASNDQMTGGADADTFDFNPGTGLDSVLDFTDNIDTIRIDPGFGFANVAAVLASTIQSGNHARILLNAAGTDSVYLINYLSPGSGNTIAGLGDDIVFG